MSKKIYEKPIMSQIMANYSQNLLAGSCSNVSEEPHPIDGCPHIYHGGSHGYHGGFRFF